jgi:3-deoxy-D-manno-octulosonic acid kinase
MAQAVRPERLLAQSSAPAPPGFVRRDGGSVLLVADAAFVTSIERLGLAEAGGLARATASSRGPSGRGHVSVLSLPGHGERLCLRPLHRGGWLGRLLPGSFASLTRPLAELTATAALRAAGAPVPRPLLVVGERRRGNAFDAAVGTVFEEGTQDGLQFLDASPERARVLLAATAAGAAIRRFHDAGGCHADLHVKNLLLRERAGGFDALVIDLDRARVEADVTPRARLAELMRLYRSLVKRGLLARVGPRGCARFFAAYAGGDRKFRRALRAGLPRERLLLALHRLHYRGA